MNRKKGSNQHTVDMLFVITLFCAFAVCASLLIALGANIYKSTIDSMDKHYTLSTASSFITEKVHQHDAYDAISVGEFGDGKAIILKEEYSGTVYNDYIYSYDGYIREMLVADGLVLSPESGSKILAVDSFELSMEGSDLLTVSITDTKGESLMNTIYIHSH